MKRHLITYPLCAALLAASCSGNEADLRPDVCQAERLDVFTEVISSPSGIRTCAGAASSGSGDFSMLISYADPSDQSGTKGAPVEDLTTYGSFALYGYLYDTWGTSVRPSYMFGEKVIHSSGQWKTSSAFNTRLSGRKLRFYALAPFEPEGVSVSQSDGGPLSFSYAVPKAAASQKDILVGSSPEYSGDLENISVSFSHCLSAVSFRTGTGTVDGIVRSITLKGVYSCGRYTAGTGWSGHSGLSDFTFTGNVPVASGSSINLTEGSSTMMMIPQTVPSGATVEVVIESGGNTHTLSAPISGDKWQEGKRCIYSLSFDSISGMKITLSDYCVTVGYGEYKDVTVTGDPPGQNWRMDLYGGGYSAMAVPTSVIRITGTNITGTDEGGYVIVTTEDGNDNALIDITSVSLQESISLSPSSVDVPYGGTAVLTASGAYPEGYTSGSIPGATVTMDGNSISVRNGVTSYTGKYATLTVTTNLMKRTASASVHLKAKPETIRFDRTELTLGSSGTGTVIASGDYDSFTASLSGSAYASLSKSGNTLTVTNRNTTFESQVVTLTGTTDGDTKAKATATLTLSPVDDYVIDYEITAMNLSTTNVDAGGGNISVTGAKVRQIWASGKTVENYADAVISVARTSQNGTYPASVSGRTITVNSLGTDTVSQGTYIVTASFSKDGISADPKTVQFTQDRNRIENSNGNPSDYTAYVAIGNGITAAGEAATVTYYAYHKAYNLYSSGASDGTPHTVYDPSTVVLSFNGNSAFSLSGSTSGSGSSNTCTVSHSNMAKNVRTDKVTVKVTNASSTSACQEASKSVTNNRYTGTKYTKNHTKTGSITYGSKSYGTITYGTKSYGSEYVKGTDYGSKITDSDTYGPWSTYETDTDCYSYSVSFAVTSWSPDADAANIANAITASHYERAKYSQRRTITHNYHQSYTQHYYRDYTRSASRPYTRTASQNCDYIEYRTDTFDSGAEEYVEESKSHTETWTDSGTEALADDTGSEWYRDNTGTSYSTADGGYDYQTTYGTGSKKTDSVTPSSSQSWLTYSGGRMYVTANSSTSPRTATLSVSNGTESASCSVTQGGAEYDIDIL